MKHKLFDDGFAVVLVDMSDPRPRLVFGIYKIDALGSKFVQETCSFRSPNLVDGGGIHAWSGIDDWMRSLIPNDTKGENK